ncbi:phenylalanine--tRNA ligase subunit beta [Lewinella sp. LCG006]|uniref:phenylalanine--tRNA ligase subunit beta n=1 Tax=Lewinella sp. LCG006 TaxID=3231911 RepID=UPI00345F7468
MNVSLSWLRQYIDTKDLSPETIGDILTSTGLEVEGMEEVETIPGGLRGLVIGEVKECGKHPDADRLSLTKVDVGGEALLSIVCGAPNVAAGQKVVVATVGAELHPVEGDPFTIKKGKIRGEVSEGMICAEDEIGIGHSHAGIIVLPAEAKVGQAARDYYGVETDYVYEIGLTPNRSDATNHLGVAYDLAAALRVNHHHQGEVQPPDVAAFKVANTSLQIPVEVRNTEACPRYSGVTISNLTIKESPDWLKARLNAVGVRPINNVVDITNFVLHELGQPLHAFDLDEIKGKKIIVETLPAKTKFLALDEVERELHEEDLMICDGEEHPMCMGGVFGGIKSGVKESTTAIFLESAHFDPEFIRRTSMRHNLRTDAAKVYEKGSDPNITVFALKRAALLLQELAGGVVSSEVIDIYPKVKAPARIEVRYQRVNELIGVNIPPAKVHSILEAMGMAIIETNDTAFTAEVPTNKSDVLREVDMIEEILRIYGFNNVPIPSKVTTSMAIAPSPSLSEIRNKIGDLLAAQGFNEMMALSLSESRYYRAKETMVPAEDLVYVNNTSNVHLDIMRPHMVYSGLEAIIRNQNRQESDLRLFEFGRTYRKEGEGFEEINRLTLFMTGRRQPESWLGDDQAMVSYYGLKAYVDGILTRLGIQGYQQEEVTEKGVITYGTRYFRGAKELVRFGRLQRSLLTGMDIKGEVFYADFNWDNVFQALPKKRVQFTELNKYPSMRRDLALVVDHAVKFSDIAAIAGKTAKKLLRETNLFDLYINEEQLGAGKKSYAVSFIFEDPSRTLKVQEIDKVMEKIIATCESQLGAQIRR